VIYFTSCNPTNQCQ